MSRWFRLYDDTLNDPKILKLSDKTHRIWIGILCVASKNNGELPPFEDMSLMLRMKPEKFQPELEKLIAAGLIDHDDNGMRPHNWHGRQYKSDVSTERVKRFRNNQRNVSVTPPDTDTESKKKDAPKAPSENASRETTDDAELYSRGKKVLGVDAGGLIARLLKSKKGNVALARAAIEQASTKENPREYIGAILRGPADVRHTAQDKFAGII